MDDAPNVANDLKDVYVAILAGGSGTRFWPKSRHLSPKQLTALGGAKETMLEMTLNRLDGFVPPPRRLIVTHMDQASETARLMRGKAGHILSEPDQRNTANALAYAALQIDAMAAADGVANPIMISLHADHMIKDVPAFLAALTTAVRGARAGQLVLLGITPEYPETGYGYIERGAERAEKGTFAVKSFREKPPRAAAEEYLRQGNFFWNAGLFIWQTKTLLTELAARLPETVAGLRSLAAKHSGFTAFDAAGQTRLSELYRTLPKISIDHAVLEVATNVVVVPAVIGWQDIGSWDALDRAFPADARGNLLFGDALVIDADGNTIDTDGPFVAALGVQDLVIVCAKNAVLVCPKARAQDVKMIVDQLKEKGRKDLL